MAAAPNCPCFSKWVRVTRILEPDDPMGCPRDTAPPAMLTFAGSNPSIFSFARATTLNASLNSKREISDNSRLAFLRAIGRAFDGAIVKSIGSTAASPYAKV